MLEQVGGIDASVEGLIMTAQLFCRFMRVGNALYPEDHLSIELYILCYAKLMTALVTPSANPLRFQLAD